MRKQILSLLLLSLLIASFTSLAEARNQEIKSDTLLSMGFENCRAAKVSEKGYFPQDWKNYGTYAKICPLTLKGKNILYVLAVDNQNYSNNTAKS